MRDVVLLLTHSADFFTVERVAEGLARRGLGAVRIDTDRFPAEIALSSHRGPGHAAARLRIDDELLSDEQVRAVWYRRVRPPRRDDALDPTFAAECAAESQAALDGFFDSLAPARWVDPPGRVRAAANKLFQLRAADEAGLRVPETVVTNDPDEVRALYHRLGGNLVAKLLRALTTGMGAPPRAVYTSPVRADDLADLESLSSCPMVFQERIAVACEIRVAYVDGHCFAGGLAGSPETEPDWRRSRDEARAWRREVLDDATVAAVRRLMDRLGLAFGALDIVRTPDGQEIFLEVNPAGEWGMLERALELPISDAIAEALAGPP